MESYHAPASIIMHPNSPPPVFAGRTPEQADRFRRVFAQGLVRKDVATMSPLTVALIDRLFHLCEEFTVEDVHRWFRTSAHIEFGEPLPCEEWAPELTAS